MISTGGLSVISFAWQPATNDAVPVLRTWANLSFVGSAVRFTSIITGTRADGQQHIYAKQEGSAVRNSTGVGIRVLTNVLNGYTSTTTLPWAVLATPTGWAATCILISGTQLQVRVTGAAATNIYWDINIDTIPQRGTVVNVT